MQHRISFCTVCMNRTIHLKETFIRNIQDNMDYGNIEFILLDYGSRDDMYEWAQTALSSYINAGLVSYYRTTTPLFFHMSHSKNMAFRLGTGDILCGIDADNYTGAGFAAYVNEQFNREGEIFIAPPRIAADRKWWDVQGRVCVRKEDFHHLKGYDEKVVEYGFEDQDFKSRLEAMGRKRITIKEECFLHAITHDNSLRIADSLSGKNGKDLFMACIGEQMAEVIYLQENNIFEKFLVASDSLTDNDLKHSMLHPRKRETGLYYQDGQQLQLYRETGKPFQTLIYQTPDHLVSDNQHHFHRIKADLQRQNFLLKRAIYMGKRIFADNKSKGGPVNESGFGEGAIYKNFGNTAIHLGAINALSENSTAW